MSRENLELVRRSIRAFNERDIPTLEAIYSEDIVVRLIGGFADLIGPEFRGQEAALSWIKEFMVTVEGHSDIEAIHEVKDQVVAIIDMEATGGESGAPSVIRNGFVYSFRDGLVSAVDGYFVVDDALKAVGLEE